MTLKRAFEAQVSPFILFTILYTFAYKHKVLTILLVPLSCLCFGIAYLKFSTKFLESTCFDNKNSPRKIQQRRVEEVQPKAERDSVAYVGFGTG